jgi:redox-sensitive bicupin YhaK (pirin superfamily)
MKNIIIKSTNRYLSNLGWLKSYHIFSFADYYDPSNMWFWNMRVFNDDYIDGKTGFWLHPHSNMEILTIVLDGEITHWDNMWNKASVSKWQIQTMSAGTGIFHSEENLSDKQVHLYQIWFLPTHIWNKPTYKDIDLNIENNKLNLIASNWNEKDNWFLDSDVKVFFGKFDDNETFEYNIEKWRWLFMYVYLGELLINETVIKQWDQLRFENEWIYNFKSNSTNCEFVLIDVTMK